MTLANDFEPRLIRPTVLFDLELDSGSINFWNGPHSVEVNGTIYVALHGISGGISIRQSLEIEDLSSNITLSGTTPEILAIALSEDFQNRVARVHLASLDESLQVVSTELVFSGFIEDIRIQEGPDNPGLEILVRGTFADLEPQTEIRYSAADQKQFNEFDTFFDFLEAAQESEPRFGG